MIHRAFTTVWHPAGVGLHAAVTETIHTNGNIQLINRFNWKWDDNDSDHVLIGSGCRNTSSNEVKDLQSHPILTFVVIWLASLLLFSVLNHRKLNILSFRLLVRHKKKFKDTSGSRKLLCVHYCIKWLTKNVFIDEWILLVIPLSPCDTISHQIR